MTKITQGIQIWKAMQTYSKELGRDTHKVTLRERMQDLKVRRLSKN